MSAHTENQNPKRQEGQTAPAPPNKVWMRYLESATGKQTVYDAPSLHTERDENTAILKFRCAQTTKPFFVVFRRYSRNHKFQVMEVRSQASEERRTISAAQVSRLKSLPERQAGATASPI